MHTHVCADLSCSVLLTCSGAVLMPLFGSEMSLSSHIKRLLIKRLLICELRSESGQGRHLVPVPPARRIGLPKASALRLGCRLHVHAAAEGIFHG